MPYFFNIICKHARDGVPDGACTPRDEMQSVNFDEFGESFADVLDALEEFGWTVIRGGNKPKDIEFLCPDHGTA